MEHPSQREKILLGGTAAMQQYQGWRRRGTEIVQGWVWV
jgi:hypothetical protein